MSMCSNNTPIQFYKELGLWVKREDSCCLGGPNFSKTRGVFAHIAKRPEQFIGVLDTSHSQGGWAVAKACKLLGKQCVLFYPVRKSQVGSALAPQQQVALELGAQLLPLQAGRSAVLYHQAKKWLHYKEDGRDRDAYMMPNALKLAETVDETAAELRRTKIPAKIDTILVSASSGTIAAGIARAWSKQLVIHMGYSRPLQAITNYMVKKIDDPNWSFHRDANWKFVDEGYAYADEAMQGISPPFPSNSFYDLKAVRWWDEIGRDKHPNTLLWNIG